MAGTSEDFTWIDSEAELAGLIDRLHSADRIAVDTESNSMHAYHERVCLVQLTVDGDDVLVDPLAVDITPLGAVLADASVLKVFHGADYDVLSLKRAYGFEFRNLYDTMIAARVLGWPKYGLAAILQDVFGHAADKRFQRYDWGRRPLDDAALAYARYDTHFLLDLYERQMAQLRERDRVDECLHACDRQARVVPRAREFDPDAFWKIKGATGLAPEQAAVLKALFVFRNEQASDRDVPPFRIMGDSVLLQLARTSPTDPAVLAKTKGTGPYGRGGKARGVLRAIERGLDDPAPVRPKAERPPKAVTARFEKLRSWRKNDAQTRGVEPDVVIPKSVLWAIAESDPRNEDELAAVEAIDDWEHARYGAAIIEALQR